MITAASPVNRTRIADTPCRMLDLAGRQREPQVDDMVAVMSMRGYPEDMAPIPMGVGRVTEVVTAAVRVEVAGRETMLIPKIDQTRHAGTIQDPCFDVVVVPASAQPMAIAVQAADALRSGGHRDVARWLTEVAMKMPPHEVLNLVMRLVTIELGFDDDQD